MLTSLLTATTLLAPFLASAIAVAAERSPPASKRTAAELVIDVTPAVVIAKQDIRARVQITPRPANRLLVVALDAPEFFSSTQRQLEGANAARVFDFYFHDLPAGDYMLSVKVEDDNGRTHTAERPFTVIGVDEASEVAAPRSRRR
jgi:hypothetical protein